jgi:hypothetical protein
MTARTATHWSGLLVVALLSGAAAPAGRTPFAMAQPLPGGVALPNAAAPSAFTPAPVPDLDQDDYTFRKNGPAKVEVTPNLFHQRETVSGDGFTPNSTIFGEQTKRFRPTPSLNLSVPLQ